MNLKDRKCKALKTGTPALDKEAVLALLVQVPGWDVSADGLTLKRLFSFDSYGRGLLFVNTVGWIAQNEQHHPDIELGYKKVMVSFSTHSVGGLSDNDFICAAKVSALLD
jgi:4a-hydroxytetrahydrobiopterin dehydratase